MRFEEFEQRLNRLLDERQDWEFDPEIARLIRDSVEHRALASAYSEAVDPKTLAKIDPLPRCHPPADLAARVLAELADKRERTDLAVPLSAPADGAERPQPARLYLWYMDRRLTGMFALAAALLVAVGLYVFRPQSGPDGSPLAGTEQPSKDAPRLPSPADIAAQRDAAPDEAALPDEATVPAVNGDPTIGALATEARDKYAQLALDTQKAMSEVAMLLPGFGGPARNKRSDPVEEAPLGFGNRAGQRSDDWAGQVGDGLEPLTRSAVGALDFILQALPVETPTSDAASPEAAAPKS